MGAAPSGTFTDVGLGASYACALRANGALRCWGEDEGSNTVPPAGRFRALSVGPFHACAIRDDGRLRCWGVPLPRNAVAPGGVFRAVSVGLLHACAIRNDGRLACWGRNGAGQSSPPAGTFITVGVGYRHSCGIRADGTLVCWGDLEDGGPPPGTYTALAADALCAIREDAALVCWGGASEPPSGSFKSVSRGSEHACAIRTDSTVICWGSDEYGQVVPRPTAAVTRLAPWRSSTGVSVVWAGAPTLAPAIAGFDVQYRQRPWSDLGAYGPWTDWLTATATTTARFSASPGTVTCFRVRSRDSDGFLSDWTRRTCTAIPVDDRDLTASDGWSQLTGGDYYRSTALRATTRGARVVLAPLPIYARAALVATTCPRCGTVNVYLDSTLIRRVSLYSPTRIDRRLIEITPDWRRWEEFEEYEGRFVVKVVSSGKPVIVDGIAVR